MAIKIRRGTDTDRIAVIFEEGEVIYTTDTKSFFIGDGVTAGGNQIGGTTAASLLKTTVHNATGATLTKGQVVYLSGNTGNKPNAVLAQANSEATSSKTIGLIILNISNNANGDIATDGLLSDLNTSAFVAGDLLWLSDSIAGGLTTIIPDTPNHAVFIGYVVRAHATQGSILIHIQNGYELNEIHDVKITSVQNNDGLIYDSTLGYWKNSNTVTLQGNTFNAANKLVQLDGTAKLPAVDGSQLTNLPSFTPPNGLLKIASSISTTLQTVTDYLGNLSVLQLNSRRVGILSDSSVTTQTSSVIQSTTTNANLVIAPNGTGALIADIPDGTATGGNARGINSVDLQTVRTLNNQIAQGNYSNVLGGLNNRSLRLNASVLNGSANQSDGEYSVVLNGTSNISGQFANNFTTVINGDRCNASATHSIASGNQSTASNSYAISLGDRSTTSGINSFSYGGAASGNNSFSFLGTSTALRSYCFGAGTAYLQNMFVQGAESFNQSVQSSNLLSYKTHTLTTGATTVLSLDGTGVTALIIPSGNNRAWNVQVNWVALVQSITGTATGISVGDVVTSIDLLAFKKVGGVSSASAHTSTATKLMVTTPAAYAACAIAFTAGASQEMALTFTGPTFLGGGSVTMKISARIELTEVAYT